MSRQEHTQSEPKSTPRPPWWNKRWSALTAAQRNVDECAERLEDATEANDEANAALASYQAEIEAAATARAST